MLVRMWNAADRSGRVLVATIGIGLAVPIGMVVYAAVGGYVSASGWLAATGALLAPVLTTQLLVLDRLSTLRLLRVGIDAVIPDLDWTIVSNEWRGGKSIIFLNTWLVGEERATRRLEEALANRRSRIDFLFPDPQGPMARAREQDLRIQTTSRIKESCKLIKALTTEYDAFDRVSVRLYPGTSALSYHGLDSRGFVGVFWKARHALDGPHLHVTKGTGFFADAVFEHLDALRRSCEPIPMHQLPVPSENGSNREVVSDA